jgi:hypothetical protein
MVEKASPASRNAAYASGVRRRKDLDNDRLLPRDSFGF